MGFLGVLLPMIRLYLVGVRVLLYQLFNRSFTLPALPKQNGRVAIVTGGARGMGYEVARRLTDLGMHVIIAGNVEEEGLEAVTKIRGQTKEGKVEFLFLDLSSLHSVRQFAQRFKATGLPLHVLVNNAGVMMVPESQTEDGYELQFGLNFLGHFLLTHLLLDTLKRSGHHDNHSRIVNMTSATHYGACLNLDDLQSRSCYSSHGAYAQSKLALVMFTYALHEQLSAGVFPVSASAVDPGMVDTDLYQNLCSPAQTPAEGASTALYAALATELEGVGGCYLYNGRRAASSETSYDQELQAQLWRQSCSLAGI
ncbi:dehydrogenase/reductase SDR family member on chromosome X isoform X2 [Clupea harengus]|uniref:Dehydrogenase/reductase SDR family member on chromosome X isoform X2 n=1 Tax=Clupea harengus TaxID=7950 RepID=A0A6P8EQQ1_CLUHA|nr:dehydrogenase/reductase SDR family member on chromosome X isoform X2 [Clupea harengus]